MHSVLLVRPIPAEGKSIEILSGIVKETHDISLGFKTPGQIATLHVKEGDYVRQGELIATLDDTDYRLGVEASEVQYKQLADEVERLKQLYAGKSLSANDYEKAVAGLKQVGVQLQSNRNKLDYTRLYAPVAGCVQSVNFAPSEMVDAGTPVINLLDLQDRRVEVNLPAGLYERQEQMGRICLRTASGKEIEMKQLSLVPKADGTGLYKMLLVPANEDRKAGLTAGANVEVRVTLTAAQTPDACTLPLHAVGQQEGQTYVWTLRPDTTVRFTPVEVLRMDLEGRAVVRGLKGDEQVVKAGVNALQENQKVKVIEEETETNVGGLI